MQFATCFALALLGCGVPLGAQSWDTLRGLNPGDPIKVVDRAGQEHKGTFAAVSEAVLSVQTHDGAVAFDRARVRRVQVRSSSRRLRHILIGAAIGLAVGVAVDQTVGTYLRNESGDSYRAATYIAPIAIFGGIGAAVSPYHTVYRAR